MINLKIIGVWLKHLIILPTNLAKVASINEQLKIQQELAETQQRLKKAENQLAKYAAIESGRMFFLNNVAWSKDKEGNVETAPYCPRCFELDGKAVHLIKSYEGIFTFGRCLECKVDKIPFRDMK